MTTDNREYCTCRNPDEELGYHGLYCFSCKKELKDDVPEFMKSKPKNHETIQNNKP